MSKADKYVEYHNAAADDADARWDYVWGAEGQDVNGDGGGEADCSGGHHAALVYAGIPDSRTTADGYRRRAHSIPGPSQIGDFFCLLAAGGAAHHIGDFIGNGTTVEWRGKDYGVERHTVASVNARGARWYRQDSINALLGAVSAPPVMKLAQPSILGNVVVHRVFNPKTGEHLLTIVGAEALACLASGWSYDGPLYEYDPSKATIPVWRLIHNKTDIHLLTSSAAERDAVQHQDYRMEGIAFYASASGRPVWRLHHNHNGTWLWTTSAAERDAVQHQDYLYEGPSWLVA